MFIRDFNPGDIEDGHALDRMFADGHNIKLSRDYIIVADGGSSIDHPVNITGCLAAAPSFWVHRLQVDLQAVRKFNVQWQRKDDATVRRVIAESILSWSLSKASMMGYRSGVFSVLKGNSEMQNFVETRGAVRTPGEYYLYHLDIPPSFYPRKG